MKRETKECIGWWVVAIIMLLALLSMCSGCKTRTVYVPVESVRTEYKDRVFRDSLRLYDSIYIREANDTIRIEKYKYVYRDKLVRDSILITDSIAVPYPVTEYIEVNRLSGWQKFQLWCGRILLVILIGFFIYKFIKKKLFS